VSPVGSTIDYVTDSANPVCSWTWIRLSSGSIFIDALQRAVSTCEALLVMIGPNWLDSRDESGRQRLEDPDDYVRVEVETGLRPDIRVIPILVADARMPAASDLPESLRPLSRRQAVHTSSSLMEPSPVAESST